jgi:transposase, IS30 family
VERLSICERERIAELLAEGAPFWRLRQEVPRSRHAIKRAVRSILRPAPVEPKRSRLHVTPAEREEISRGIAAGDSLRVIARRLGRAPSTVSREVARHGGRRRYRACRADRYALQRMRRPKVEKLARCPRLRAVVEAKLELRWSPEQIAGWLSLHYPDDPEMRVSHETIYLSLFVQTRGALRKELTRSLRQRRSARRPGGDPLPNGQSQIPAMVNISDRPADVEDRAVPGHWEGDLLCGAGKGVVATLVERHSRFVMLVGLPTSHTAEVVAAALAAKITELPAQLRRSLTWDQGREMARHAEFTIASGVPVYFCDPRSPWQRGTNENTNGLLRQYLPRRSRLGDRTQTELDQIATELNNRPRQTLAWKTPSQVLDEAMR